MQLPPDECYRLRLRQKALRGLIAMSLLTLWVLFVWCLANRLFPFL